ncbi:MAG: tyrosinase family protein [Verrucomicrobiales bacterium]|nr:tyrosinase family protein [Verrucomicrobiales bacterium]
MTATEKEHFINAVLELKNTKPSILHPTDPNLHRYDDYVELHLNAMAVLPSWAHNAPAFFSWHRELIRHFEMDLQAIDSTVSVPYWDWLTDQGTGLPIWDPDPIRGLGTNGVGPTRKVMDGAFAFDAGKWTVRVKDNPASDPDNLTRRFTDGGTETLSTIAPSPGDIGDQTRTLGRINYDSAPWWDLDSSGFFVRPASALNVFRVGSEYDLHNLVQRWISGNMGQAASPNDPIFWFHHCNLDRLWSIWQRQHPTSAPYLPTPPTTGVPAGHRSDESLVFTDATHPTPPWPGSTTSASLVNHHTISPGGYWYDTDPKRSSIKSRTS